jgi:hypothetical protein
VQSVKLTSALIVLSSASLTACENPSDRAERRFSFIEANGASKLDLCKSAKQVAESMIDAESPAEYRSWSKKSEALCAEHDREMLLKQAQTSDFT